MSHAAVLIRAGSGSGRTAGIGILNNFLVSHYAFALGI